MLRVLQGSRCASVVQGLTGDEISRPRFFAGFAVTGEVGEAVSPAEGAASGGGPRQTVGDGGLRVGPGRGRIEGLLPVAHASPLWPVGLIGDAVGMLPHPLPSHSLSQGITQMLSHSRRSSLEI